MRDPQRPLSGSYSAFPERNRPVVVLGVVAVLLIAGIAGGIVFAVSQAKQPGLVLSQYCADLTHQKYADAYTLLSSGAHTQASATQWAQDAQVHDQLDGAAKTCSASQVSSGPLTFASAGASATLTIARAKSATGLVVLTHQVDGWKIDKFDAHLQGTDLGPLTVSEQFCAALAKQDYSGAYAELSSREHAGTSQADFTKDFTQALSGAAAKVTGCTPQLKTYAVQAASATVDVQMQLQVAVSSGSTTAPVPLQFTLVPESTGWKIDAIKASGS